MPAVAKPIAERLWIRAIRTDTGCLEWQGARNRKGYGVIQIGVRKQGFAHRVAYEEAIGPIPAGKLVCHRCDNPRCIEPDHLFTGDATDNLRDASRKGRIGKGHHVYAEALRQYRAGEGTQAQIAAAFGISRQTLSRIHAGSHWIASEL